MKETSINPRADLVDSHCHLHFDEFDPDREACLEQARQARIKTMLTVGIDPADSRRAVRLAQQCPAMRAAVGIHPQLAGRYSSSALAELAPLAGEDCVVAIGETGLDLHRQPALLQEQRRLFAAHVELAHATGLPLIIHDREAHGETLTLMDECDGWANGGVIHCFSGDAAMAARVVGHDFLISVSGVVTYPQAESLRRAVVATPLAHLLVETDAPYLAPVPQRGRRNEPAYVRYTLAAVAALKGLDLAEMARITTENFERVFDRQGP